MPAPCPPTFLIDGRAFRVCRTCKRQLPADAVHFHPNPSALSGLRSDCRACVCNSVNVRYKKQRNQILPTLREKRRANPEPHRQANRRLWEKQGAIYNAAKHSPETRQWGRQWRLFTAAVDEGKQTHPRGFTLTHIAATGFCRVARLDERLRPAEAPVALFRPHLSCPGLWVVSAPLASSSPLRDMLPPRLQRREDRLSPSFPLVSSQEPK